MRLLKACLKQDRGDHGFSLIEMVIIIVLIGIMAVPIGRLAVLNLNATSQSLQLSEALNYAQGSLEEIMAMGRGTGWDSMSSSYSFRFSIPGSLSRSLTVVADSLDGVAYKVATVTVTSGAKAVSFSTLLVR